MDGEPLARPSLGDLASTPRAAYVVPRYRAQGDTAFFHFLHGTVPGHQIDFMYCPEVPQGPLGQTHFGHLARLMKYIEPRENAPYAFAVGNLSRDDVQHEPGHGGLAILFALRVAGVIDHAGRDMLPYAHGIVAVNRALDRSMLLSTMIALHRRFLERDDAADWRADFYRGYVHLMEEQPDAVEDYLHRAIQELDDVPQPPKSALGFDFTGEDPAPRRIAIVHDDDEPFGTLALCAASIAAALYRSDVKWTSITSGREIDIAGGTTIRLVPRSEAPPDGRALKIELAELAEDEDTMMASLFGAKRRTDTAAPRRKGWREKLAEQRPGLRSEPPPNGSSSVDSQDRSDDFDVDLEVDDAAATIALAGLETDRDPVVPSPSSHAARFPSSPPRELPARSTGAHAARGGSGASFDPRRSSPVGGVAAAPAAFDARRSSPVGGVPAVSASAFDPRRSSPVAGLASPLASAPASIGPPPSAREPPPPSLRPGSPPPSPALDPWPPSISPSSEMDLRVARGDRERKGRWIIAAAAFAAIAVIVVVAVTAGIRMSEEASGSGESAPDPGETTSTAASVSPPAPAPSPRQSASATAAPPGASAVPPKNPSKGRRK